MRCSLLNRLTTIATTAPTSESTTETTTVTTTKAPETTAQTTVEQTTAQPVETEPTQNVVVSTKDFVLNTNSKKYHETWCRHINQMSPQNRQDYNGTSAELASWGYEPCGTCH